MSATNPRPPALSTAREGNSSDPGWRFHGGGPLGAIAEEHQDNSTDPAEVIRVYKRYGETTNNVSFDPGVVFSAYHHISGNHFADKKQTLDEFISPKGQWICSKLRKFVVVQKFLNHCLVIPIFTYGNHGLQGRKRIADEYIGVFDSEYETGYQSDTPNGQVPQDTYTFPSAENFSLSKIIPHLCFSG